MRWTQEEYEAYIKRTAKANPDGLRPVVPKQDPGPALDEGIQGKGTGGTRFKIVFRVFAVRPCDWDNYNIKPLQDLLVKSGIIPGDDWKQLNGEVIPCKAKNKAEERTEIELTAKDFEQ